MASPRKNELAALGLVNREPMHGYRLNQAIHNMGLEHWTTLSRSSIYAALRRLAKRGAASVTRERQGQMPMRSVYHITPNGQSLLVEILREALAYVGPEDRYFYLGLAFVDALPAGEIVGLLEHRSARLREELDREKQDASTRADGILKHPHALMMHQAGIEHLRVEIRSCNRLLDLFRSNPDYFTRTRGASHG